MAEKALHTWFIDPRGNEMANEILGRSLQDENAYTEQECADGKKRNVYRCPDYEFVANFERKAKAKELVYKVYVRTGLHGKLRPRDSIFKKRRKRNLRIRTFA